MNEQLKNRLIGALVLLAVALLTAFLLPKPGHIEHDEGVRRVTIDLDGGPREPVAEGDRVTPPVIAAPDPATDEPLGEDALATAEGEPEIDLGSADGEGDSRMAAAPVAIKPSETLAQAAPGRVLPAPMSKAPPVQLKQDDRLHGMPGMPAPTVSAPPTAAPSPTTRPPAPAAVPVPATPQIAPRPRLQAPPVQPPADMAAARPVPVPKPAPTPVAPLPPKPELAVVKPAPAPVVKPEPVKPEPAKAAGKERWSVQVGSYADLTNARTAESKLKAAGLPTQFGPVDTAKGVLYRVRVAPLADEAAAQAAKARVAQLGFAGANVRRD